MPFCRRKLVSFSELMANVGRRTGSSAPSGGAARRRGRMGRLRLEQRRSAPDHQGAARLILLHLEAGAGQHAIQCVARADFVFHRFGLHTLHRIGRIKQASAGLGRKLFERNERITGRHIELFPGRVGAPRRSADQNRHTEQGDDRAKIACAGVGRPRLTESGDHADTQGNWRPPRARSIRGPSHSGRTTAYGDTSALRPGRSPTGS